MFDEIVEFIKSLYPGQNPVPLHAPVFLGNEKKYLADCIDSTFVSYVGKYVTQFEEMTAQYAGAKYAIAMVNGTTALQIALQVAGVKPGDEVITQPLTFVATANAISHCGAIPVFVDVDIDTMGLSPQNLKDFLLKNYVIKSDGTYNRLTEKRLAAIVPMHTFGFPCRIDNIVEIADSFNVPIVEDSAESLGSYYKGRHTGTFGIAGILSYNGNKTITTGGGGMIITDSEEFARKAKHLSTTAKVPHTYEFVHDMVGYNYRLPNVNAAIGVAQMEKIEDYLANKRNTSNIYREYFGSRNIDFTSEMNETKANYWLNVIRLKDFNERNAFLDFAKTNGVMTRPIWRIMNKLEMYKNPQAGNLDNSKWLEERVVNIPSGYRS
ncbi:LegC family aminotransferase [Ignavibacteriales bacterium]